MESEASLTSRQRLFLHHLLSGLSATAAYYAAGYQPATRFTAHRLASRLRRHPKIRACLRQVGETAAKNSAEAAVARLHEELAYLTRLIRVAPASITENHEFSPCRRVFKNGGVSIRLPCKLNALRRLTELSGGGLPLKTQRRASQKWKTP